MCTFSVVGDKCTKIEYWPTRPNGVQLPKPSSPKAIPNYPTRTMILENELVRRKEFEALRNEVEKLKKSLEAALAEDIANGEPDCEMEDKVAIIKQIAKLVGVDLNEVFPNDGT